MKRVVLAAPVPVVPIAIDVMVVLLFLHGPPVAAQPQVMTTIPTLPTRLALCASRMGENDQ